MTSYLCNTFFKRGISTSLTVELDVVKEYLYVTHDHDDALITRLITSATAEFEDFTDSTASIEALHKITFPDFTNTRYLRAAPIIDVVSIDYKTLDGNDGSFTPTNGFQIIDGYRTGVKFDFGEFDDTNVDYSFGITISYKAGFLQGEVPAEIVQTILDIVAFRYENRGSLDMKLPPDIIRQMNRQRTSFV